MKQSDAATEAGVQARILASLGSGRLVNLVGPLGVGKTQVAAGLDGAVVVDMSQRHASSELRNALSSGAGIVAADSVDSPQAVAATAWSVRRAEVPVLVVSRRPLLSWDEWTGDEVSAVGFGPRSDADIDALAVRCQVTDPAHRDLVVRLAMGIPLLARAACRALHAGSPAVPAGPVADRVARVVHDRLARERPAGQQWQRALSLLASVGPGDEELLAAPSEVFATLAELSVVTHTELGLGVAEPYRMILDLAHRWRRPLEHRSALTRAAARNGRLLSVTRDRRQQAQLVEHGLFLADEPAIRDMLFPPARQPTPIEQAGPGDADDVERLGRRWARQGGFDLKRSDRIVGRWLEYAPEAFHLARDPEGRPIGVATAIPLGEATVAGIEPLLQQHTASLLAGPGQAAGVLVASAFCEQPEVHASILRHMISLGVQHGRIVVCTPNPAYQRFVEALGFAHHGAARDDVYRCGRSPEIYSQDFAPDALPGWLEALSRSTPGPRSTDRGLGDLVGDALEDIHDPEALARSPLLTFEHTPTVSHLRGWLRAAVEALAASHNPAQAEAGQILLQYHLHRAPAHHVVARQLHLTRSTYFRRRQQGLEALTGRFRAAVVETTGM
ncbi:hypothetical protein ACIQV3_39320 [Streptomyces sp. NPDC099050]|uniref:hypothetical protein n=1 Tax=Streptomyces sp. NPDC099050 TaxID=3366100 RepID=UPI00382FAF7D